MNYLASNGSKEAFVSMKKQNLSSSGVDFAYFKGFIGEGIDDCVRHGGFCKKLGSLRVLLGNFWY